MHEPVSVAMDNIDCPSVLTAMLTPPPSMLGPTRVWVWVGICLCVAFVQVIIKALPPTDAIRIYLEGSGRMFLSAVWEARSSDADEPGPDPVAAHAGF